MLPFMAFYIPHSLVSSFSYVVKCQTSIGTITMLLLPAGNNLYYLYLITCFSLFCEKYHLPPKETFV